MSENLPQDIVMEILSWLPPKPLIKFRCVSKSWYSMISSPHFIKLHTDHTLLSTGKTTHQVLLRRYSKPINSEVYSVYTDYDDEFHDADIKIEYPFRDCVRFYYRIVGSCNGVICLLNDLFEQPHAAAVKLWNPAIRRILTLPTPPSWLDENLGRRVIVLGFGFDARSSDYKVVRIAYVIGDRGNLIPPRVEVYALNGGNWHTVEGEIPKNSMVEFFWSQVFIHGNVHWVVYKMLGGNNKLENVIMSFDVGREVFDEMPLPGALKNEPNPLTLRAVDLDGALAVVRYEEYVESKSCLIWVMREYGEVASWTLDYTIDLDCGIGRILGARRNGDVMLTTSGGDLVAYSGVRGTHADLGLSGSKESFYVGLYYESLVLLTEGSVPRQRLPRDSISHGDVESESSSEGEDSDEYSVEKGEVRMLGTTFLIVFRRQ